MIYPPITEGRPSRLRAIWNWIRRSVSRRAETPDGLTVAATGAEVRKAWRQTRFESPKPEEPIAVQPAPRPGTRVSQTALEQDSGIGTKAQIYNAKLHIKPDGTLYTEAQFSGLRKDERLTVEIDRSQVNLHYVSRDGSILTPEEVRGLDREHTNGLTMIDLNRVKVGLATRTGKILTEAEVRGLDREHTNGLTMIDLNRVKVGLAAPDGKILPAKKADQKSSDGLTRVRLHDDKRYISENGRLFSAEEVHESHPDLRSGVREIGAEHTIKSGYASRDGRLYTPKEAEKIREERIWDRLGIREVDLSQIDIGYVARDGQIFGRDDVLRISPAGSVYLTPMDLEQVERSYVSQTGVIYHENRPDLTAVDTRQLKVRYLSPDGLIYTKEFGGKANDSRLRPIDLDRHENSNRQQKIEEYSISTQPPVDRGQQHRAQQYATQQYTPPADAMDPLIGRPAQHYNPPGTPDPSGPGAYSPPVERSWRSQSSYPGSYAERSSSFQGVSRKTR